MYTLTRDAILPRTYHLQKEGVALPHLTLHWHVGRQTWLVVEPGTHREHRGLSRVIALRFILEQGADLLAPEERTALAVQVAREEAEVLALLAPWNESRPHAAA